MSAAEAAALLGVKPQTLYAYVSRGLLTSVPGPGRARRYPRDAISRLKARASGSGGAAATATRGPWVSDALSWGEPVLESAITSIAEDGPRYRGVAAVELMRRGATFEEVAERLWGVGGDVAAAGWSTTELGVRTSAIAAIVPDGAPPLVGLAVLVPALAALDAGRWESAPIAVAERARALVRRMAAGMALGIAPERARVALDEPSVARVLAVAVAARRGREGATALDRALVAIADHELNVSTFAARVAASAGADPYACVSAALGALSGPRHGGACDRIEALVEEVGRGARARSVIDARARRGDAIPGFEHPLYPAGDPRAWPLLEIAMELGVRDKRVATLGALIDDMRARGRFPTVDVALVALAGALDLGPGTAAGIFAVGRTAGWIAHAIEQRASGVMLRPRGRYVGE